MMSRSLNVLRVVSRVLEWPRSVMAPSINSTTVRWKHAKTRAVKFHVKGKRVERLSSKPLESSVIRNEMLKSLKESEMGEDLSEEEAQELLMNTDKIYDEVAMEEQEHAIRLRNILFAKELNPHPPESNLLYWAAKQQIKYLHRRDPIEWSPERIAEEFPISVIGAKRLLRNNFRIKEDKIALHDTEVDLRWRLLRRIRRTGKCPEKGPVTLHKKTIQLYLEDKLQHEDLKSGNPEFPRPSAIAGIRVPVKVGCEGTHFQVLQEYKRLESSNEQGGEYKETMERILEIDADQKETSKSEKVSRRLNKAAFKGRKDDDDDPEAATVLDLPENFRMPFVHEFTGHASIQVDNFKELLDHQDPPALESNHVEKKPRKNKHLRKESTGSYELRQSKFKKMPKTGKVDEENEDGTYRIGRTVYDTNGEVLYRIS